MNSTNDSCSSTPQNQTNPTVSESDSSVCLICLQSASDSCPLYKCSVCGITVHKYCYGIADIQTPWTCQHCLSDRTITTCCLCEKDDPRGLIHIYKKNWAHILCLLLCEDCGFAVNPEFEIINGLPEFSKTKGNVNSYNYYDVNNLRSDKPKSYRHILLSYYGEECALYTHMPSPTGIIQHTNRLTIPCCICHSPIQSHYAHCYHEECSCYFHPACLVSLYYHPSSSFPIQFAPRLTGRGYSLLISCNHHITKEVAHLPWSPSIPTVSMISQIVSYQSLHPCHLCQDVILLIKARKEEAIKKGYHDNSLLSFIRTKQALPSDPSFNLSEPYQYSVDSYMHYILNADIHIYEQQACRYSKGEFADYPALLRDTLQCISDEEIFEVKLPENETPEGTLRHSTRLTPSKLQGASHFTLRSLHTRSSDKPSVRKPPMSLPSPLPTRKRSHPDSHSSSTQPYTSERFWKDINSIYFRPLPKQTDFIPSLIPFQSFSNSSTYSSSCQPLYSWENDHLPTDSSYHEISILLETYVLAEIVYLVSTTIQADQTTLHSMITKSWTNCISQSFSFRCTKGKTIPEGISITPPSLPDQLILKSICIYPLEAARIDRRFDPIGLEISSMQSIDKCSIDKLRKIYDIYDKRLSFPEEVFLKNTSQLMTVFHNYDCFCQIKKNFIEAFNQCDENLTLQLKDTLIYQKHHKRRSLLFPMDSDYCTICHNYSLDRDDENFIIGNNPIIYCSCCNIGVHLKCIGYTEVPETFICDKCAFLRRGGDPALLYCSFCPIRYGYLFECKKSHHDNLTHFPQQRFCHLHCALFSDGGAIQSFCKVSINYPTLNVGYVGSTSLPGLISSSYSIPLVLPTVSNHSRSSHRSMRSSLPAPIAPSLTPPLLLDCTAMKIDYLSDNRNILFNSFRDSSLVELESRYCATHKLTNSYRPIYPALEGKSFTKVPTNDNVGNLCMICRLPVGITVSCSAHGCTCSFHLSCLWAIGGEITIHDKGNIYIDNGVSPSIEAFCLYHQKKVNKELLKMRIIQRNKYRIPAITTSLDTLLKEVSFQDEDEEEEEEEENDEEKNEKLNDEEKNEKLNDEEKKEKLNDESSVVSQMNEMNQSNLIPPPSQSTTEVFYECCICGYGSVAPPLSFCLDSYPDNQHPIHEQGKRKTTPSFSSSNSSDRVTGIINEWSTIIDDLLETEKERQKYANCFCEGNRGCFWKCVCCGCIIHEKCFDYADHWMLFTDDQFKYYMCLKCLLADPITDYSNAHQYAPFYDEGIASNRVRSCMSNTCCICDKDTGYLTYTSSGSLIHKQCGFSLPNAHYNMINSAFNISKTATITHQRPCFEESSSDSFMTHSTHVKTHVEFVIPPEHNPASSAVCSICRSRKGCLIRCGYQNCTRCFHVSCLDHSICVFFPTKNGLFVRCNEHIPLDYQYDPILHVIVPNQYLSIKTVIKGKITTLRKLRDMWEKVHSRIVTNQKEVVSQCQKSYNQVIKYYNRKIHFCTIKDSKMIVEKSMLSSWCRKEEGMTMVEDSLLTSHDSLKSVCELAIQTIENNKKMKEKRNEIYVFDKSILEVEPSSDSEVILSDGDMSEEYFPSITESALVNEKRKEEEKKKMEEEERRKREEEEEMKKREEEEMKKRREEEERKKMEEEERRKKMEEEKKKEEEEERQEEERKKKEEEKERKREERRKREEEKKKKQEEQERKEEERKRLRRERDRLRREKKKQEEEMKKEKTQVKPAPPTKQVKQVKSTTPATPDTPATPVKPVKPTKQIKPTTLAKSITPTKPTKPTLFKHLPLTSLPKEIETYTLQATSLKLPRKKLPPINSTTYDGLSNRGSWDNLFRQAIKSQNKNELLFGKLTKSLLFKSGPNFEQYSRSFITKSNFLYHSFEMVFNSNPEQNLYEILIYELKQQYPEYSDYLEEKWISWKNDDNSSLIDDFTPEVLIKTAGQLKKQIDVQYTESTVNILKTRILANTQKKTDDQKSKCILCNLFEHSPAIRTLPQTSFICNCCLENRGSLCINLFLQIYYKDEWRLCKVIGWNRNSHQFYLHTTTNELLSLFIGDYFHFYRTDTDVLYESTVGSIRYYSILKNNTLLLQNAFEEGEDAPEGLAPKGYYDNSKQICKICQKNTSDATVLLCDNCNDGYHLKCVRLRRIPDQHWYCENCKARSSKFNGF